jgi:peptidoglycan/xylan/chitin deacetylase (PgdA/CDA1 family)
MSYQEHLNLAGQTTTGIARDIGNAINLVWRCLKSLKIKRALLRGGIVVSCIALVFLLTTAYPRSNFGDEKYVIQTGPGNVAKSTFVQLSYLQASAANLHQQPQVLSTYNGKVAVLMYHDVGPNSQSVISITPQHLDADLTLLQQEGFHIIPISQMVDFMDHRATVPEKAVVLTFDDGYQGVYQYAFPILKKHHAPATIFIIGYTVGKTPGYLTWPEAQEMEASGLVTVGGHTYNLHWQGPTIKPNVDEPATIAHLFDPQTGHVETEQEYEARILADSRLLQETFKSNLGHTTPYFAYPYGTYNTALIRILGDAGFRYMFTTSQGVDGEKADPTRLYRITVGVVWVSTKKMPSIILSSVSSSATPSWSYLE